MNKDITIYDIAKEAKVSPATVSRVLTSKARVSPAKKEAVQRLIDKYNFQPNAMAKGLSDTETKILGIMTADIRNPFYAALAIECEKAANESGYTVLLCNMLNDSTLEESHLEKLYAQRVDAIIQIGCRVDDLVSDPNYVAYVNRISRTIPFITSGRLDGANCYTYNIDHAAAMRLVMDYLLGLGHREIALIGGSMKVKSTYDKWLQYIYMMGQHNVPVNEQYLMEGDYSVTYGYECMKRLMAMETAPTAIIAVNDYTAVGALRAITEKGKSVPADYSLISYDNTFLAEISSPKLTSIDYDYQRLGAGLIHMAIAVIRGEQIARSMIQAPSLVKRDSCSLPVKRSS